MCHAFDFQGFFSFLASLVKFQIEVLLSFLLFSISRSPCFPVFSNIIAYTGLSNLFVLNFLFAIWFAEAVSGYGLSVIKERS